VEPGVEVAVFAPYFPAYQKMVASIGGVLVPVPTKDNSRVSLDVYFLLLFFFLLSFIHRVT